MTDQNQLLREALKSLCDAAMGVSTNQYDEESLDIALGNARSALAAQPACTMGELCPGCPTEQQIKCLAADAAAAADETNAKLASNYQKLVQDLEDPTYRAIRAAEWGYAASRPVEGGEAVAWTERELELIDGMIQVHLDHAARCDGIANRGMADRQKLWDMERVALLKKVRGTTPPASQEQAARMDTKGGSDLYAQGWNDALSASQEQCSGPLCGLPEFGGNCHPLCSKASHSQAQQPSEQWETSPYGGEQWETSPMDGEQWETSPMQQHSGEEPSHEYKIGILVTAIGKVAAALKFPGTPPLTGPEALRLALGIARHYERQPSGEVVAWMWQHDETGRTGFVDRWQVESGWKEQNPRLKLIGPLTLAKTPKPEPMTELQISAIASEHMRTVSEPTRYVIDSTSFAKELLARHGIKGQA
jgi:hypothetical protein